MTYKIIITPDAITQAAKSYRKSSANNYELVERLYLLWDDVDNIATSNDLEFIQKDEIEIARGGNYAFDFILEAYTATGKTLTTAHMIKHLRALGCQHPKEVMALFLQSRAEFQFHIGALLVYFLLSLGETLPPQKGTQEEGGAKRAEFHIHIHSGSGTTLVYDAPFSMKKMVGTNILETHAGRITSSITITKNKQFLFQPIMIELDESKPDVRALIQTIKRNAPFDAGHHSMTVDAKAIQACQNAMLASQLAQPSTPKATPTKKPVSPSSGLTKNIAGIVGVSVGLTLIYAGLVLASLALLPLTTTLMSAGLIVGAAACMGVIATLLAVHAIKSLISGTTTYLSNRGHKDINKQTPKDAHDNIHKASPVLKTDDNLIKNNETATKIKTNEKKHHDVSSFFSNTKTKLNPDNTSAPAEHFKKSGLGG